MPVAITCPLCRAAARVPYEMLGQRVRCPACLQTILAPSPDDLLPTVTLAPPTEPDVAPPVAHVLSRPAAAPDRPWLPAAEAVIPERRGGSGVVLGLVLGAIGLVIFASGVAWFLSVWSSDDRAAQATAGGFTAPAVPPGWEAPDTTADPGSFKPPGENPVATGPSDPGVLAGPAERVGAVTVTPITVAPAAEPGNLDDGLCWSADGARVFILTGRRQLIRADVPGFGNAQQFDFTTDARGLALSAKGLVVTLPAAEEVCVVGPDTLQVKTQVGVTGIRLAVTAPGLSVAYGFCWRDEPAAGAPGGPPVPGAVVRIDLDAGTVTPLAVPAGLFPLADPAVVSVAADGRSLTTPSGRYAIADDALRSEPATPEPARPGPTFAQDESGRLVVQAADGKPIATHDLGALRAGQQLTQFFPHPAGKGLFVTTPQALLWVELPGP